MPVWPVPPEAAAAAWRYRRVGRGGQLRVGAGIGIRGLLGRALFDHPYELFVWRPERLPDADGVVHDLGDRGVPIAPLAVVKNPVAADHKVVGITAGERGDDGQLFARTFAHAIAVGEISAGHARHGGVTARVIHRETEIATALVQIQRARLKNGLVLPPVKITKVHEVAAQLRQIPMIMNQAVEADNGGGITFVGLVLGDQRGQCFLRLGAENFPGALQSDFFDRPAGLAGVPGVKGCELADERVPIRLG